MWIERIFFFFLKLGLGVFTSLHLLNFPLNCFSQSLFCFSYFYRGRSLSLIFVVHRGSCCSSKGELPLSFIELNCFLFPWFSFFSHVYCHSTLCLSCLCQYVTKRGRNKWNVGILFVLFRGSWICFWKRENIKTFWCI